MKEYDSILKEKKVYEDPIVHHSKYTKYVILYIVSLIILLIVSYGIYYQKILSPSNVFLSDMNFLLDKYSIVVSKILPENLDEMKSMEGTLQLNDVSYDYKISRDTDKVLELSNSDTTFFYRQDSQARYVNLSSFSEKNVQFDVSNVMFLDQIKKKVFSYLGDKEYVKRLYMDGKTPVVEVNLVLGNQDIADILGMEILDDNYEFMITLKNHALNDTFLSGKLVVNNKTKNTRLVFQYEDDFLECVTDDGKKYKVSISTNNEDFTLRVYHEEELYSILLGKRVEKSYQYVYQIIDRVYNVEVSFSNINDEYRYDFVSNIEYDGVEKKQTAEFVFRFNTETGFANSFDSSQIVLYQNLSDEEKNLYQEKFDNFFSPLKEFLKNYQTDIE